MKLLMYVHSLENGGAERVVSNLANHWAAMGWELTLVTVAPRATDFYALDPRIRRACLAPAARGGRLLAGAARTASRALALRRILRSVRPDVAIAAMQTASVVLALASWGMRGMLAIGSEHNYPAVGSLGAARERARGLAYGGLDAVVALTAECAAWLQANTRARRVPVIPNPVPWPLPVQQPVRDPAEVCRPGRRILLAVGRLSEEKNFATLIDVFWRLAARHPSWDLVILGEGEERFRLEAQVQAARLGLRVLLPGRVGNMGQWYVHANLYAMSSYFEGFPNTLAEAMACGLPAVSFDCDTGPRDIIRHERDGCLVTPGDSQEFETALDRLMGSASLRNAYAAHAVEARDRFSIAKISDMWLALFSSAGLCDDRLSHRPPAAARSKERS
ncbi:glycosyltransferase family 4 protein [Massilia sp. 9I]|uniref:glycosyltransferase family 4 protein n=1 Tax=Massilia sp. 9I TaxID=2653152 RepID=UPI0012F1476C|nr:glycosyltransferase family 4 protein [Massilia sp. 9I]VXB88545.1 Glycosyl transferase, group 1 family protein [Massilia sp. 9I]